MVIGDDSRDLRRRVRLRFTIAFMRRSLSVRTSISAARTKLDIGKLR